MSLLGKMGLPPQFGITLLLFFFALTLVPYFAGKDFGILKIPEFENSTKRRLRRAAPALLLCAVFLHLPILKSPETEREGHNSETQSTETSTVPQAESNTSDPGDRSVSLVGESAQDRSPNQAKENSRDQSFRLKIVLPQHLRDTDFTLTVNRGYMVEARADNSGTARVSLPLSLQEKSNLDLRLDFTDYQAIERSIEIQRHQSEAKLKLEISEFVSSAPLAVPTSGSISSSPPTHISEPPTNNSNRNEADKTNGPASEARQEPKRSYDTAFRCPSSLERRKIISKNSIFEPIITEGLSTYDFLLASYPLLGEVLLETLASERELHRKLTYYHNRIPNSAEKWIDYLSAFEELHSAIDGYFLVMSGYLLDERNRILLNDEYLLLRDEFVILGQISELVTRYENALHLYLHLGRSSPDDVRSLEALQLAPTFVITVIDELLEDELPEEYSLSRNHRYAVRGAYAGLSDSSEGASEYLCDKFDSRRVDQSQKNVLDAVLRMLLAVHDLVLILNYQETMNSYRDRAEQSFTLWEALNASN